MMLENESLPFCWWLPTDRPATTNRASKVSTFFLHGHLLYYIFFNLKSGKAVLFLLGHLFLSLYGLDPGWVYMIVEDDWAWSYQLTGSASSETTSSVEVNPFSFENTPRTVNLNGDPIVKHAESVTINHFKTLEQGSTSREEHYKSSKTNFESR